MKRTRQEKRSIAIMGPDSCASIMTGQWAILPQSKLLCLSFLLKYQYAGLLCSFSLNQRIARVHDQRYSSQEAASSY